MISITKMAALEANSEWRNVSRYLMMENAGANTARTIMEHKTPEKATIFSGTGNNGGDGFVVARHLVNMGVEVDLVLIGRPRNINEGEARSNWDALSNLDQYINFSFIGDSTDLDGLDLENSDVIVDAMLGTGITGAPREPVATAIDIINEAEGYKVAVDVPSGLNPETGEVQTYSIKCDLTVTFHETKPGLVRGDDEYTGNVVVADIGIPRTAEDFAGPGDVQLALRDRKLDSHKGQNGRVLVVGGGSQYAGAPAHAGLAALNTGADLATVAAPKKTAEIIGSFSPDLIAFGTPGEDFNPDAVPMLKDELDRNPALILGPGLGTSSETGEAIEDLMELLVEDYPEVPVVLDADGLKLSSERPELLEQLNCVATPHTKEFEYLSDFSLSDDLDRRIDEVSSVAQDYGLVILLKSPIDICAGPDGEVTLNDTGNPGMTVGGTGDVLTGIVGALISKGTDPFQAGAAGLFLNGLAGDICEEEKGYSFVATDVKERIPTAISRSKKYW